jgi:L-iditol 2-dehydrogenase
MKAVVLTAIQQFQMQDLPDPVIKNNTDVLIKMAAVRVCGSDIHYYTNGKIGNRIVKFLFVLGHEGAGVANKL